MMGLLVGIPLVALCVWLLLSDPFPPTPPCDACGSGKACPECNPWGDV